MHHADGNDKLRYIREHKKGCVEIDFSHLLDDKNTREDIRQFLANDKTKKEWLCIVGCYDNYEAAQQAALTKEREHTLAYLKAHPGENLFPHEPMCFLPIPFHSSRHFTTTAQYHYRV